MGGIEVLGARLCQPGTERLLTRFRPAEEDCLLLTGCQQPFGPRRRRLASPHGSPRRAGASAVGPRASPCPPELLELLEPSWGLIRAGTGSVSLAVCTRLVPTCAPVGAVPSLTPRLPWDDAGGCSGTPGWLQHSHLVLLLRPPPWLVTQLVLPGVTWGMLAGGAAPWEWERFCSVWEHVACRAGVAAGASVGVEGAEMVQETPGTGK